MKLVIGETNTIGILDADELKLAGAVAGVVGWRAVVDRRVMPTPDWHMEFMSTESLRMVTLALIGVCGSMGINPEGPN